MTVLVAVPEGLQPLHRLPALVAGRRGEREQLSGAHGVTALPGARFPDEHARLAPAVRVRALVQSDM